MLRSFNRAKKFYRHCEVNCIYMTCQQKATFQLLTKTRLSPLSILNVFTKTNKIKLLLWDMNTTVKHHINMVFFSATYSMTEPFMSTKTILCMNMSDMQHALTLLAKETHDWLIDWMVALRCINILVISAKIRFLILI